MPLKFYGVEDSMIEPFLINNEIFIDLIKDVDYTEENNVKLALKSTGGNG